MADEGTNTQGSEEKELVLQGEEAKKVLDLNQRLKGQLTDLEKKYNQFTSIYKDIDPDEAKTLKAKLEEAERKSAEKDPAKMEEIWDKKLKKFQTEAESERQSLKGELEKLRADNKTLRVTDKVMAEISGMFTPDAQEFLRIKVNQLCDLDEDGTIIVKDENGDPMFRNGKYMGLKDLAEQLVEKYPSMARAQGSSGTKDATATTRAPNRGNIKEPTTWAELQAMGPAGHEWLDNAKRNNPAAVTKILDTLKA
jgi:hypothetical protein